MSIHPIALEASERTPLLQNPPNALEGSNLNTLTSTQLTGIRNQLAQLSTISASRKIKIKTAAFLCAPFSLASAVLCCPCDFCSIGRGECCADFDMQDHKGIPYCKHTTCESTCAPPLWRAALPPISGEDTCDLRSLICDPCVLCVCCDKSTPEVYLTRSERDERTRLIQQLTPARLQPGAPVRQIMETTSPEISSIDALLAMRIHIPDLRNIVHGYCYVPPSSDTRLAESQVIYRPVRESNREMGGRGPFV